MGKKLGIAKSKSGKPFLAARIPEELDDLLQKHTESTGESRTDSLINALAAYLGWNNDEARKPANYDRLSWLEKRIDELEAEVYKPKQTNLLDVVQAQESPTADVRSTVIKTDNKTDKRTKATGNRPKSPGVLNNRQISNLTGIDYEAVRSRFKRGDLIEHDGQAYAPVRQGGNCRWRSQSDNN
jgi:hypothetical protein